MAVPEAEKKLGEIEASQDCPFHNDLCEIGGKGCLGQDCDWKKCGLVVSHGTVWKRLLVMRELI